MSLMDLLSSQDEQQDSPFYGVVIGLVTNNQDPEGMGRVKVQFPWRENPDESHWARVATLMAGKDRGSFFLPEVGDEVLLAFGNGDAANPYVIGALWNGKDQPPSKNEDGNNNLRMLKSRSGHQVIFDDSSNAGKLEIHTQAGHIILLDDSAGNEKIEIKEKSGVNSLIIDSTQNSIVLESQAKLTIKSSSIEINADAMMTIKAGGTLTIQGALVKIN